MCGIEAGRDSGGQGRGECDILHSAQWRACAAFFFSFINIINRIICVCKFPHPIIVFWERQSWGVFCALAILGKKTMWQRCKATWLSASDRADYAPLIRTHPTPHWKTPRAAPRGPMAFLGTVFSPPLTWLIAILFLFVLRNSRFM